MNDVRQLKVKYVTENSSITSSFLYDLITCLVAGYVNINRRKPCVMFAFTICHLNSELKTIWNVCAAWQHSCSCQLHCSELLSHLPYLPDLILDNLFVFLKFKDILNIWCWCHLVVGGVLKSLTCKRFFNWDRYVRKEMYILECYWYIWLGTGVGELP